MKNKEFLEQTLDECNIVDLAKAILLKDKETTKYHMGVDIADGIETQCKGHYEGSTFIVDKIIQQPVKEELPFEVGCTVERIIDESDLPVGSRDVMIKIEGGTLWLKNTKGNMGYSPRNFKVIKPAPEEEWPRVFENSLRIIEVYKDGRIAVSESHPNAKAVHIYDALPILYKAVELSKELRK